MKAQLSKEGRDFLRRAGEEKRLRLALVEMKEENSVAKTVIAFCHEDKKFEITRGRPLSSNKLCHCVIEAA
jgi:hypothetical protein